MYLLPSTNCKIPVKGCSEKIKTYLTLANLKLPILKSVLISNKEIQKLEQDGLQKIKKQLKSNKAMLRYIYYQSCHNVRNGGKIIDLEVNSLMKETEAEADMWLLEPSFREYNRYCCNICLDKDQMNLHMEILGKGFDISDINKGKICPHEIIDIPYPIYYGMYEDWWKWSKFYYCTQKEYEKSVILRKKRLKIFDSQIDVKFESKFCSASKEFIEKIFSIIEKIESNQIWEHADFYNLSCSLELSGRLICWDIQTPNGKLKAYW